jgi:hypothetical protein
VAGRPTPRLKIRHECREPIDKQLDLVSHLERRQLVLCGDGDRCRDRPAAQINPNQLAP